MTDEAPPRVNSCLIWRKESVITCSWWCDDECLFTRQINPHPLSLTEEISCVFQPLIPSNIKLLQLSLWLLVENIWIYLNHDGREIKWKWLFKIDCLFYNGSFLGHVICLFFVCLLVCLFVCLQDHAETFQPISTDLWPLWPLSDHFLFSFKYSQWDLNMFVCRSVRPWQRLQVVVDHWDKAWVTHSHSLLYPYL